MDPPAKVARRQGDLSARSNAPWHAAVESSLASRRQTHGCPASVDWQEMPAELVMVSSACQATSAQALCNVQHLQPVTHTCKGTP